MDDLQNLLFEKVLSYLPLEDLLRARAVSKTFYLKINSSRVRSLCFSEEESDFIEDKHRLVAGEFARNFISSSRFESFFRTFDQSILCNLTHLRVCNLNVEGKARQFIEIVNSFKKLKHLDLIRMNNLFGDFKLILPELKTIRLDKIDSGLDLFLDTPSLSVIWSPGRSKLNIMHPESVETIVIHSDDHLDPPLESFKNLKILHHRYFDEEISNTLLSSLNQLKEIHLEGSPYVFKELHDQKRRYGRNALKIYYYGVCLDHPDDYNPLYNFLNSFTLSDGHLSFMAANYTRLSDQLPFLSILDYSSIVYTISEVPTDFWTRLINSRGIKVNRQVFDVDRFLDFLSNFPNVPCLEYSANQPQSLLAQLPFVCSPQVLRISNYKAEEITFVPKFKDLIGLELGPTYFKLIWMILKRPKFFRYFSFQYCEKSFCIKLAKSKPPRLYIGKRELKPFTDIDEMIEFLSDYETPKRSD